MKPTKRTNGYNRMLRFEKLEHVIADIFESAGYKVSTNHTLKQGHTEIDVVAQNKENIFVVEVKTHVTRETILSAGNIIKRFSYAYSNQYNVKSKPMLIVADIIPEELKKEFAVARKGVILVDISQLLFAVDKNVLLYKQLIDCLNYSVDKIGLEKWDIKAAPSSDPSISTPSILISRLESCPVGKYNGGKYEDVCIDVLKYLFDDVLLSFEKHATSNMDLYEFDIIARIKDSDREFWNIVKQDYNSRVILFECKNYGKGIDQTQIYTTEKYLYSKALRSVGIIIARNGANERAIWAAKGCLRENGKLLLIIDNNDLIKMIKMKETASDPSEFLLEKLFDFLLHLEK